MNDALAIYIHWPFCASKCPYCDFNSFAVDKIDQTRWKAALLIELKSSAGGIKKPVVNSVYFGGGSPSLMAPDTVSELIAFIRNHWDLAKNIEITLEANPTSIEAQRFQDFRNAGVTRLSVGAQSFDEQALRFLGRDHTAEDARNGIRLAAKYFNRFSFDLIYGRPGQTTSHWRRELDEALALADGHLSLYQLSIEPGTTFYRDGTQEIDEETAVALYEISQETLESHGYVAYEVSNYARPGKECRHNLACWRGGDYLGIGPGAHGRLTSSLGCEAVEQIRNPEKWLGAVEKNGHGTARRTLLDSRERYEELFLTGLRLDEGIIRDRFNRLTGAMVDKVVSSRALERLINGGFLELNSKALRATKAGRLRLNSVLIELLAV